MGVHVVRNPEGRPIFVRIEPEPWNQDMARPGPGVPDGGPAGLVRRRAEIDLRNSLARAVRLMIPPGKPRKRGR